ncbi:MAG: hypothetical protein MUP98_07595 [Candidatus Aminicenantes bacterium]|nr:hypothetical protein [Candidatus Aminicenantes bacterium]
MICSISKWLISGAVDSHREVPGFLRPHINRCVSCRDFIHLTQTLEKRAAEDAQFIINETPDSLQTKVKTQPLHSVEQKRPTWRRPHTLIPIVSVSFAAILLVVFLVFQPSQVPSPSSGMDAFLTFGSSSLPEGTLLKLASQIEFSYDAEWNNLKKNVESAAKNLRAQLDFKRNPDQ